MPLTQKSLQQASHICLSFFLGFFLGPYLLKVGAGENYRRNRKTTQWDGSNQIQLSNRKLRESVRALKKGQRFVLLGIEQDSQSTPCILALKTFEIQKPQGSEKNSGKIYFKFKNTELDLLTRCIHKHPKKCTSFSIAEGSTLPLCQEKPQVHYGVFS